MILDVVTVQIVDATADRVVDCILDVGIAQIVGADVVVVLNNYIFVH
jgi:hypothetical protein